MTADEHASRTVQPPALSLVTVPMPRDLAGPVTPMLVPVPAHQDGQVARAIQQSVSTVRAVSAECDRSFPDPTHDRAALVTSP